jgi:hypothetical protein
MAPAMATIDILHLLEISVNIIAEFGIRYRNDRSYAPAIDDHYKARFLSRPRTVPISNPFEPSNDAL